MIDKESAEYYSWGEGCDGWHLVRTPLVSVIQERMPAGASEVRHYHRTATQFFYVLEGSLSIEVEGIDYELYPRQGLSIAAGHAHQVFNRGTVAAEFLVVSNPPSHGDRVPA